MNGFSFKAAVFSIALLFASFASAQESDSSAFCSAEWQEHEIGKGLVFRSASFNGNLFGSNQYISIIEVTKKNGEKGMPYLCFATEEDLTGTSVLAEKNGAAAAVNGNFFKFQKPHNAVDYLRIKGVKISGNAEESGNGRAFSQLGVIAIDNEGLSILKPGESLFWEDSLSAPEVMTAGPLLIHDTRCEILDTTAFYKNRHPRTAVALLENGEVLLITADGRNERAHGLTLQELQKIGKWLEAKDLVNLDGGGSTTMYVKGYGVVNHPSDNKLFDNKGERKVANALLVMIYE